MDSGSSASLSEKKEASNLKPKSTINLIMCDNGSSSPELQANPTLNLNQINVSSFHH